MEMTWETMLQEKLRELAAWQKHQAGGCCENCGERSADVSQASGSCVKMDVLFKNRAGDALELSMRYMNRDDLDELLALQDTVLSGIENLEKTNMVQSCSPEELAFSLEHDICVGVYRNGKLVAIDVMMPEPRGYNNPLIELEGYSETPVSEMLLVDYIIVDSSCRGFGLQHHLFELSEYIARERGLRYMCGVASPLNVHSNRNFEKAGFELIATRPRYRSVRNFYYKKLED